MIHANENTEDGILEILKDLQQYQAVVGDTPETSYYGRQGITGDQLSVERAINCQFQSSNGFTPAERFDGMHFEISEFHTEMKFLQVPCNKYRSECVKVDLQCLFSNFKF